MDVFAEHQQRTLELISALAAAVEPGLTLAALRSRAEDLRSVHGFDRWYRPPRVHVPRLAARALRPSDVVTLEVAPATEEGFGLAAVPVVVGGGDSLLAERAAGVCRATCGFASPLKTIGELFVFARAWANNRQATLVGRSVGGRALGPAESPAGFPYSARVASRVLHRHRARLLHPHRIRGTWIVRPVVEVDGQRAWAAEIIRVDDERREVLGRDRVEEAASLR